MQTKQALVSQWFLLVMGFTAYCLSFTLLADEDSVSMYIQDTEVHKGLINTYYSEQTGNIMLRIPKTSADYLFQTSLPRGVGSNDIGLDRGQLGETRLVTFKRLGNKVLLTQKNTLYRASANNRAEKQSIDEAFADSVLAGFELLAEDEQSLLIDYTPYLLSDVHGVQGRLQQTQQGSFSVDTSRSAVFAERTKSFPLNTELEAVITFTGSSPGQYVRQVVPDPNSITVHLHHSFIALPDNNYTPRAFHPMSGFWEHSFYDYSVPITDNIEQQLIVRHRLNKKDPKAAISEAVEPIIYYLDPGIPEPVFSALKEGALWWDQAFQAIGYNNAFQVKVLPEDADPMDVRYNVIQWVHRATRGWSYGTSVVDPRTGELIKGHVTLGSLRVRQDYLIALGLTSPFKKPPYDTSKQSQMALDRIKQLSAHEVGHTLGLAHNFAASESGRASVMDYPHPKISIKKGKIVLDDAYDKGIGAWDKLTIAYGYQDFGPNGNEALGLAKSINAILGSGIGYKSDPDSRQGRHASADGHLWDNGADPIKEFDHLSDVRQLALSNMGEDTIAVAENLSSLSHKLVPIYLLHRYQINALAKQLGGIHYTYEQKRVDEKLIGTRIVEPDRQAQALDRLVMASTPEFLRLPSKLTQLIPPLAYGDQPSREDFPSRMGRVFDPISAAEAAAYTSLSAALHPERLARLNAQQAISSKVPKPYDVVKSILFTHWQAANYSFDPLAERLRQVALQVVFKAVDSENMAPEITQQILSVLSEFELWLSESASNQGYPEHETKVLLHHFNTFWKQGTWPIKYQQPAMPPGSPI